MKALESNGTDHAASLPDFGLIDAHRHIALSFSGGKDSLALAYMLEPRWAQIRLYHVSTGDLLPETVEIVRQVESMVPNFCELTTDAVGFQERFGLASDIVPHDATVAGRMELHGKAGRWPLVDRLTCCAANRWAPLQQRLQRDGITLVIRGTRREDPAWGWLEAGGTATSPTTFRYGDGMTIWAPLADWKDAEVFAYLRSVGAPIARYYENPGKHGGPECARCPAWLDGGRGAYLRKHHPALAADYYLRLARVKAALRPTLQRIDAEMEAISVD